MGFLKGLHLDPYYFLFISMILGIALTNLQQVILPMILVSCTLIKKIKSLETILNTELKTATSWLKANRLSLNVKV